MYRYALTIQKHRDNVSESNYNKTLDLLEIALNVEIFPRYFEVGKVAKRLHVHCMLKSRHPITFSQLEVCLPKNMRKCVDFAICGNFQAWLNYIAKESPNIR
jgi:hypothetical protein